MRFLEKIEFNSFGWLDFENLPNSQSYRLELYPETDSSIADLSILFHSLFRRFNDELIVGQFGREAEWGDFCIDTWDVKNDRYDYSPKGKSKSTSTYLNMLYENDIEPDYNGFCKSSNWDKFLPIILDCILNHTATYSVMIYAPNHEFVFYFHHTGSIGLYYKEMNDAITYVLEKAKSEDLEIKNTNDNRVINMGNVTK